MQKNIRDLKILIVEDESGKRRQWKHIMKTLGKEQATFRISPDSESAIQDYNEIGPEIIFLDIELGPDSKLNGLELGKMWFRNQPTVFVSNYQRDYATELIRFRPDDYIENKIGITAPSITESIITAFSNFEQRRGEKFLPGTKIEISKNQDDGSGIKKYVIDTEDILFVTTFEAAGKLRIWCRETFNDSKNIMEKHSIVTNSFSLSRFLRSYSSFLVKKGQSLAVNPKYLKEEFQNHFLIRWTDEELFTKKIRVSIHGDYEEE